MLVYFRVVQKAAPTTDGVPEYASFEEARDAANRNKVTGHHWLVQRVTVQTVYDTGAPDQAIPRSG